VGVPDEARQSTVFDRDCFCFRATNHPGAGTVNIIYGGANGLTATGSQVLGDSSLAIETDAHFGKALAAGRFRGSAFASDLAVAVPGAGLRGTIDVFFGGSRLNTTPNQRFSADGFSTAGTSLGSGVVKFPEDVTMVWGDFNGDGVGDLAAEVMNDNGSHQDSNSAVLILYGTAGSGLSRSNSTLLVITDALAPEPVAHPGCGTRRSCGDVEGHIGLAAADLDGDSKDELLIGTPAIREVDDDGTTIRTGHGAIIVVPGEAPVLDAFPGGWDVFISEESTDGPTFGFALAVGDFDGNGEKDVAVGDGDASFIANEFESGRVRVFMNGSSTSSVELRQSDSSNQAVEGGDRFGAALAAHDFNGDGVTDLAVGAPGESSGATIGHGVVTTFFGVPGVGLAAGLTLAPQALLIPAGVLCCFDGAAFGSSLTAWNFGGGPQADLAVGSPFFTIARIVNNTLVNTLPGAGSVVTLYGQPVVGPTFPVLQLWTQNPGFPVCTTGFCLSTAGIAQTGNHFGAAVY
jgi:hypothetical protein